MEEKWEPLKIRSNIRAQYQAISGIVALSHAIMMTHFGIVTGDMTGCIVAGAKEFYKGFA